MQRGWKVRWKMLHVEDIFCVKANDISVPKDNNLRKCIFKQGALVAIKYQTKDFHSIADFGRVEDILDEHAESQLSPRSFNLTLPSMELDMKQPMDRN